MIAGMKIMTKNIVGELKLKNKKAFIPFVVVGYPDLKNSLESVEILIAEGADLIELGVPFSDPVADGPVIQEASEKASVNTSLLDVLSFAEKVLKLYPGFPFILFTYYNPILKMGILEFAKKAKKIGIHSVLVVDLPPEEATHYLEILNKEELQTIFLISPTTTPDRIKLIDEVTTGFIYYVSRVGVTGTQIKLSNSLSDELNTVRQLTQKPIAVGFGISTAEQARQVSMIADAVVVGSAFVRLKTAKEVRSLAKEIRTAMNTF